MRSPLVRALLKECSLCLVVRFLHQDIQLACIFCYSVYGCSPYGHYVVTVGLKTGCTLHWSTGS